MSNPPYGKVHTTESFYDGESTKVIKEYEVSQYSTRDTMLKDIIDSLHVITSGDTHKLELCIKLDIKGRYRIISKWGVE